MKSTSPFNVSLICLLLLYLGFTLFPIVWLLSLSVKPYRLMFSEPPVYFFKPTVEHYLQVVDREFLRYVGNSVSVALGAMALALVIGVPAAYALSRAEFRLKETLHVVVLFMRMVPALVFVLPYFLAYRWLHLLDTRVALIVVYTVLNVSLVVWLLVPFFNELPRSLEESAYIDGATVGKTFLRVTLPLAAPGLVAVSILAFVLSWNEFMFALLLTRSRAKTLPVAVVSFLSWSGVEWGKVAAGSFFVVVPVLIFYLVARKYFIRGLTRGALKE